MDKLEAVHRRALAADATEESEPADTAGMPRRVSGCAPCWILDPAGNLVNLYQNVSVSS